ncbi:MAG: hypothetical protein FJZ63_06335 [Chlamydiae bacterium]|nr:hypothetical protein [Chlamydiota bacterium]
MTSRLPSSLTPPSTPYFTPYSTRSTTPIETISTALNNAHLSKKKPHKVTATWLHNNPSQISSERVLQAIKQMGPKKTYATLKRFSAVLSPEILSTALHRSRAFSEIEKLCSSYPNHLNSDHLPSLVLHCYHLDKVNFAKNLDRLVNKLPETLLSPKMVKEILFCLRNFQANVAAMQVLATFSSSDTLLYVVRQQKTPDKLLQLVSLFPNLLSEKVLEEIAAFCDSYEASQEKIFTLLQITPKRLVTTQVLQSFLFREKSWDYYSRLIASFPESVTSQMLSYLIEDLLQYEHVDELIQRFPHLITQEVLKATIHVARHKLLQPEELLRIPYVKLKINNNRPLLKHFPEKLFPKEWLDGISFETFCHIANPPSFMKTKDF